MKTLLLAASLITCIVLNAQKEFTANGILFTNKAKEVLRINKTQDTIKIFNSGNGIIENTRFLIAHPYCNISVSGVTSSGYWNGKNIAKDTTKPSPYSGIISIPQNSSFLNVGAKRLAINDSLYVKGKAIGTLDEYYEAIEFIIKLRRKLKL